MPSCYSVPLPSRTISCCKQRVINATYITTTASDTPSRIWPANTPTTYGVQSEASAEAAVRKHDKVHYVELSFVITDVMKYIFHQGQSAAQVLVNCWSHQSSTNFSQGTLPHKEKGLELSLIGLRCRTEVRMWYCMRPMPSMSRRRSASSRSDRSTERRNGPRRLICEGNCTAYTRVGS
jgi:hypothetical protein